MKRGYTGTRNGQTHYLEAGKGLPLVLLHQTPVSGRVYSRMIPILASKYRVIAPDNPGFGNSDKLPPGAPMSEIAGVILDLLDSLRLERAALFGLHTGATIAVEAAAASPKRVSALLLGGFPYLLPHERPERLRAAQTPIGQPGGLPVVVPENDGSHLMKLWMRGYQRVWWGQDSVPNEQLSASELEFVDAYVTQAVVAWQSITDTFKAVYSYEADRRLPLVEAPTLLLEATGAHERPYCRRSDVLSKIIRRTKVVRIEGADAYCVYWRPEEVSRAIMDFLDHQPA